MGQREQRERRRTSARETAEKNASFEWTSLIIPQGAKMWKPKQEGIVRLDIIPYVVTLPGNLRADPGFEHWERLYYVHYGLGSDGKAAHICVKRSFKDDYSQPCAACDFIAKEMKRSDHDAKLLKDIAPRKRQLFNIIDHADPNEDIQIWEESFANFGEYLGKKIANADERDRKAYDTFYYPEAGMTLKIGVYQESFAGNKYFNCPDIEFRPRDRQYKESIADEAYDLDAMLKILPYEKLQAILLQGSADVALDDRDRPSRRARDNDDDRPRGRARDDDDRPSRRSRDDEDQPRSRRSEPEDEGKSSRRSGSDSEERSSARNADSSTDRRSARSDDDDRPRGRARDDDDAPRRSRREEADDKGERSRSADRAEDDTSRQSTQTAASRSSDKLEVGDFVSFEYRGEKLQGLIFEINEKTEVVGLNVANRTKPSYVDLEDLTLIRKKGDAKDDNKEEPRRGRARDDDDRDNEEPRGRRKADEDDEPRRSRRSDDDDAPPADDEDDRPRGRRR